MNRALTCFIALSALAPTLISCGVTCEDLCDESAEQGCETATCRDDCVTNENLNEASDCDAQYDDWLSCVDDNSDNLCTDLTACNAESIAYSSCINAYCADNPSSTGCP